MIDGITVLSQNEIMDVPTWTCIITMIGFITFAISLIIVLHINSKIIEIIFGISSICCFILFMVGLCCVCFIETKTGEYAYKVTISDEVNFVEFNNKYEIIDQEGLIYTIKEKEEKDENKKN